MAAHVILLLYVLHTMLSTVWPCEQFGLKYPRLPYLQQLSMQTKVLASCCNIQWCWLSIRCNPTQQYYAPLTPPPPPIRNQGEAGCNLVAGDASGRDR